MKETEGFRKDQVNGFSSSIIINVPVVNMVRYEVVLRGHIHNKGHFRGGGLKIEPFFGPVASAIWAQKMALVMDMPPLKTTSYRTIYKQQVH
jgi:hypothetical protein